MKVGDLVKIYNPTGNLLGVNVVTAVTKRRNYHGYHDIYVKVLGFQGFIEPSLVELVRGCK